MAKTTGKQPQGDTMLQQHQPSDYGTPELANHSVLEPGYNDENEPLKRNRVQVPIDYYEYRGLISPVQHRAGDEFYRLWFYGSQKSAHVITRLTDEPKGTPNFESHAILEEKYREACNAIRGLVPRLIAYNVCCIGEWATYINVSVGKNRRMDLLKSALDDLAKHFGMDDRRSKGKQ